MIGTLAVDGWAVTFGTASPLLAVPNYVTALSPPINGQCTDFRLFDVAP